MIRELGGAKGLTHVQLAKCAKVTRGYLRSMGGCC